MALKNYVNKDTLISILGVESFSTMKNMAIDSGENFLSGKIQTSLTKSISSITTSQKAYVQNTLTTLTNLGDNYTTVANSIETKGQLLLDYCNNITQWVTKEIVQQATKLVADRGTKLLNVTASDITTPALKYFNEHKMSAADALKSLIETNESIIDNYKSDMDKEPNKFITKIKTKYEKIKPVLQKISTKSTEYIGYVSKYMEEGPDFVSDIINKQMNYLVDEGSYFINKEFDQAEQWKKEKIKDLSKSLGETMTQKYNTALQKSQKVLLDKKQDVVEKLKISAKVKINKAVSSLAAKIGL